MPADSPLNPPIEEDGLVDLSTPMDNDNNNFQSALSTVVDEFADIVAKKISSNSPQNGFDSLNTAVKTMSSNGGNGNRKTRKNKKKSK